MNRRALWASAFLLAVTVCCTQQLAAAEPSEAAAADPSAAPGLGDPGKLQAIKVTPAEIVLDGSDARRQLIVEGTYSSGQTRDLTHAAKIQLGTPAVATLEGGYLTPAQDGHTIVQVTADGLAAEAKVTVKRFADESPINFANEIVPVFTKLGCNAGGCHGKLSGQNGFRLSLLGFYPNEDYEYLVKEDRGRRLFPASPERSLLLLKATSIVAHGGGQRMQSGSYEHQLLARWVAQGMPLGAKDAPTVEKIEVFPTERMMDRRNSQQLQVTAHYTDGSQRDVTRMAKFEANYPELADISESGLVKTLSLTGEVAVMVRYQGEVGVFRATIPLGAPMESLPPARNFIDELVFGKLKALGVPPSAPCDDATFLRRVSLDIAGRLPTATQTQEFLADKDPTKRDRLIDRLLASPDYADYFANKWSNILRNKRVNERYARGTFAFHDWIRESLLTNKPYDQFATDLLTATGDILQNPPVAWYRAAASINEQLEDSAQLFLGMRIQCARCHHHPYERWSQNDYYGYAAFFSRVGRKKGKEFEQDESRIFHNRGAASSKNPRSGEVLKPAGLGDESLDIAPDDDPRAALAEWMTSPGNPFFARSLVNRYWKHFFGRGLVDPEDDMRVTNPPTNPALLDALAKDFADQHFDLKQLVRTICRSQTYQLSAEPNRYNAGDKQFHSRYYPKRLPAEVLYDALNQVTGTNTNFGGVPNGTRAMQLPDNSFDNYFLNVFGKPQNNSACECERSPEANLAQTLHLLNSREVQTKLTDNEGRAAQLARDKELTSEQRIRQLYYWAYAREPQPKELAYSVAYVDKPEFAKQPQQAYEDVLWALINAKEFLFNH